MPPERRWRRIPELAYSHHSCPLLCPVEYEVQKLRLQESDYLVRRAEVVDLVDKSRVDSLRRIISSSRILNLPVVRFCTP